ncbi:DUF1801 domain-containing protein [Bacteroidia bacterium]|nr:DUF1801 domain-containing protein [Bacteroidia bacterium]
MNHKIDAYLTNTIKYRKELTALRAIVLECGLTEELKWKQPCYVFQNANIIILAEFKSYYAMSFIKGVLLSDTHKILTSPGANSQSVRLVKFVDVSEISEKRDILKSYVLEAIELEKAGVKVKPNDNKELDLLEELEAVFIKNAALKKAFFALTPGRQRGYNIYFSAPKQSKTRTSRIQSYIAKILAGKGFHDCTCGRSKRMPTCDGSHKQL